MILTIIMLNEKTRYKISPIVWFHLYKIQNQAQCISRTGSQNSCASGELLFCIGRRNGGGAFWSSSLFHLDFVAGFWVLVFCFFFWMLVLWQIWFVKIHQNLHLRYFHFLDVCCPPNHLIFKVFNKGDINRILWY